LGIGSRLSRSADGVLQAFPSLPPVLEVVHHELPTTIEGQSESFGEEDNVGSQKSHEGSFKGSADGSFRDSAGAVLGVQVDIGPSSYREQATDSISDALLVSDSRGRFGKSKRSMSEEADLVLGRDLLEEDSIDHTPAYGYDYHGRLDDSLEPTDGYFETAPDLIASEHGSAEDIVDQMEAPAIQSRTLSATSTAGSVAASSGTRGPPSSGRQESADREKALMAQIKALTFQLEKEKHRKKEQARAAKTGAEKKRYRVLVCTYILPYRLERNPEDGLLKVSKRGSSKLAAYERFDKFNVLWVGYLPTYVEVADREHVRRELAMFDCVPVFFNTLAEREAAEAMSTEVLWPLLHYIPLSMLDSDTDLIYQRYQSYRQLNQACADVIRKLLKPTDLVWIHDYHLMLLPAMVREISPRVKIGWFLHTPFPSSEIYVTLPLRKEILRGMLAADLIAFHTYDYVRHFMHACARVLGTDVMVESKYILDSSKRTAVTVDAFPIGIDTGKFEKMLASSELKDKVIELQRGFDGKKLILGIDRMDYVKGIPHKLIALEKFLHAYPQWAKKIVLVQIATPPKKDTARYQKLRNKVHKLVGRINGRFSTLAHTPIHYLDHPVDFVELCALYFLAEIALITSLREGMSKVAFEFVACQQRNHGVLILSEFSGGAQTLGSGAILVNPFNTDEVSRAIYDALYMPEQEREERHQFMSEYVSKFTIQKWAEDFVNELHTQEQDPHSMMLSLAPPDKLPVASVIDTYRQANRRLIIMGLLGTLIDYSSFKDMIPMADALWKDLLVLASDPRNTVVVVSGRERALVSQWLGDLPVWIVAENSIYYRFGGRSVDWTCTFEGHDDWLDSIKPVFKYFAERTPGSMTETQEHSITWHYREADEDFGEVQASDLLAHLDKVLGNQPVEVSLDSKMVQVRPYAFSKGAILEPLMEACTAYRRAAAGEKSSEPRDSNLQALEDSSSLCADEYARLPIGERQVDMTSDLASSCSDGLDFLLCINWATMRDEDIFGNLLSKDSEDVPYSEYLPDRSSLWTCRVGEQPSQARYFVQDESDVHSLIASLANVSQQLPPEPSNGASLAGDDGCSSPFDNAELHLVPSALEHLDEIEARMRNQQLAFFLDYDGTLTPIVDNPSEAKLTEEARAVVRGLAASHPTAIVSGRARATAQGLVQLDELYYAGSHGFDITGPLRRRENQSSAGGSDASGEALPSISFRVADSFRPALEEAKARAEEALSGIPGALVEDNTFSVSIHYRMVAEENREKINEVVCNLLTEMPMLRRTYGKMVYELRPSAEWDKGKAVEWLLEQIKKEYKEQALEVEQDFFPLYIGDDVTDEDAFRVMGNLDGLGIIVSDTALEGSTAASYSLRSPVEVVQFLDHFVQRNFGGSSLASSSDISGLLTSNGLIPSPSPKLSSTSGRPVRDAAPALRI